MDESPVSAAYADALADYKRGWPYFGGLVVCVFMALPAPDGVTFFHKLLGAFGIPAGIPLGAIMVLHIWGAIPLGLGIFCAVRLRRQWRGLLGTRFARLHGFLRVLPALIFSALFLTTGAITPSLIDRAYFAAVGMRSGLRAISVYPADNGRELFLEFRGNMRTYSFRLLLTNHGPTRQTINMKLTYEEWGLAPGPPQFTHREIYVLDAGGEIMEFSLPPRSGTYVFWEFTAPHPDPTVDATGRGTRPFSVILINETEQHSPNFLVRRPLLPGR